MANIKSTNEFFNDGTGWRCRHCTPAVHSSKPSSGKTPRLFTEGESESKNPSFAAGSLARWADPARRILLCPNCGITELIELF